MTSIINLLIKINIILLIAVQRHALKVAYPVEFGELFVASFISYSIDTSDINSVYL